MPRPKRDDDVVVVWKNTSERHLHRDTDAGGIMFKPGAPMVMEKGERDVRGRPPTGVYEEVLTRKEAWKKYGKKPTHEGE